jgi:hypothetical protein
MKTEKHLRRRVAALGQNVAKPIKDRTALRQHKTVTNAAETKNENAFSKNESKS